MAKENRLVILKTANKLFRQGKIDLAIKEYNKILGIKPNDLEVRRIIGDLQLKQNNISGAVDQFEWIADYFLKEGFFAKAIAMYKRITRINPNYEGASVKLAELYTKQGLIIEAKQIYLDLAEENKRKNNYKKSLDMYKKILEFDRNNIKMRLLLADNYYREGLKDNAISEYLTAADILIHKKEFQKAEELLLSTSKKVQNVQVMEKLIRCYTNRGDDQKAIELLRGLGSDLFKDINLLKLLGELYFKSDQIDEAEKIYKKITEISSEETEIIMKLGRVYLHRNEYEKAYGLFLPIVDKSLKEKKYEDAAALLRFIIASNNSYIPALKKLASIFKISDKKNNLIALYESLIPVYEQKEMKKELIEILEELIELSDAPFTYQEQLARLTGKGVGATPDEESENEREKELINFNLRVVQEAINESDYEKAIDILQKTAAKFPDKIDIRLKLFDVYQLSNDNDSLMDEGIELLRLYKLSDDQDEFKKLLEKLYTLKPDDVRLAEYAGEEKTSIDIIFDKEELKDNMNEISDPTMKEIGIPEDIEDPKDILVLSEEESMPGKDKEYLAEQEAPRSNENRDSGGQIEDSKSLSSVFTELDFYINDGYFGDAERLIEQLREKYPKSQGLISRIERLKEVRFNGVKESTDSGEDLFDIKSSLAEESQMVQEDEDSKNIIKDNKLDQQEVVKVTENEYSDIDDLSFEIEMEEPENTDNIPIVEIDKDLIIQSPSVETKEGESNEGFLSSSEDLFELKEDDNIVRKEAPGFKELSDEKEKSAENELLDIDSILEDDVKEVEKGESSGSDIVDQMESPFGDINQGEISFEGEDEIFKDALQLDDENYFEIEKNVKDELDSLDFWLQEVEKQRTSTVEKNMMEIFDEFKKGVEEKIGQEDYDTRYNLGIAYKEMGLIEEAIHEFQISSKHTLKFFDSAGLLGICFREKGMYDDAISWLYKALEAPDRLEEEYLSVKYELVVTYKIKEDFQSALNILGEIVKKNPKFRDASDIQKELNDQISGS